MDYCIHDLEIAEIALENVPDGACWNPEREALVLSVSTIRCALIVGRF
jgi:hypothetical protein